MGTITTTNLLTFEEFERLPDQPGKRELLEGELIELPPADLKHNEISHELYHLLFAALQAAHARGEAAELGRVYHEMGYELTRNVYIQPDVSVTHATQRRGRYFQLAPAIAIEVVSPSNSAEQMDAKTELYFRHGAREVWQFYSRTRHVVVHTGSTARTECETLATPLIPGLILHLAKIFDAGKV
jgi:Uma2 family endonuclease